MKQTPAAPPPMFLPCCESLGKSALLSAASVLTASAQCLPKQSKKPGSTFAGSPVTLNKSDFAGQDDWTWRLEGEGVDGSKAYVFIASGDKAVKREVKTGENFGNKVEIISGIKAGDKLITDGNKNIADGTFIRIINQE